VKTCLSMFPPPVATPPPNLKYLIFPAKMGAKKRANYKIKKH